MRAECRYRKGGFALNFQISVGPQLRVFHVSDAFGVSSNDRTLYNNTDIIDFIKDNDECKNYTYGVYVQTDEGEGMMQEETGMLVIGDAIYRDFEHAITGYKAPLPKSPEEGWSTHHGSVRKDVERTIGLLKGRFDILNNKFAFKLVDRIQKVFKACAYFHNRILRHNSRDVFGTVDDHFDIL